MHFKRNFLVFGFILILGLVISGCSEKKSTGPEIYSVNVESIKTNDDGEFIIKGSTDAPKGTKIFVQAMSDSNDSNQITSDDADWVKVNKKGKFTGHVTASYVIDASETNDNNIKSGNKGKVKIFAATKVKDKVDYLDIPKNVRKALKKANIEFTVLKADKKIEKYDKPDEDTSDESDDSDKEATDKSDDSEDKSNDDEDSEEYQQVSYDDLARNPKKYINRPIQFSATVLQVKDADGEYILMVYMDDNPDETIMVIVDESDKPDGEILEKDKITIKGTGGGKQNYKTVLGSERKIPYVDCNEKVIDNGKTSR